MPTENNKFAPSRKKILVFLNDYAPFPYFFWLGIPILLAIAFVFKNVNYTGLTPITMEWSGRASSKLIIDTSLAIYCFFIIYITTLKITNPTPKDIGMKAKITSKGGRAEFSWFIIFGFFLFWLILSLICLIPTPPETGKGSFMYHSDILLSIFRGLYIYVSSFGYTLVLFHIELKRHA